MSWSTPVWSTPVSVSGATLTLNKPAGAIASGDLLLAVIAIDQSTFGSVTSINAPAGWTAPISLTNPNSSTFDWQYIAWKIATGSEPSTYAFTDSGGRSITAQGSIGWVTGNLGASPVDQSSSGFSAGQTTSPFTVTAGSVNDGTANDFELVFYHSIGSATGSFSTPGGLTQRINQQDANGVTIGVFDVVQASSGATPTYASSFTFTGSPIDPGWGVVTFKPLAGPTITAQPTNQTVYQGNAATFSVTATSSGGALSYQWKYSSGGAYSNCTLGSGITSASFTTGNTNNAEAANGYTYECVVTDSNGSVTSSAATLTVITTANLAWIT